MQNSILFSKQKSVNTKEINVGFFWEDSLVRQRPKRDRCFVSKKKASIVLKRTKKCGAMLAI